MTEKALVYIVDDDPGMLESTRFLLESVGLDAHGFNDGRDFLKALEPGAQGCVILDLRMPGLGGLNVQEELTQRGCQMPIIFVSGHADVPIVVRAFKSGAFDFIEKPFSEQLLLDSVQQALQPPEMPSAKGIPPALRQKIDAMTPRERDVFIPLAQGYTSREIAQKLGVGSKTADLYRGRVMKRLDVQRPQDVTAIAITAGLVDPLNLR